LFKPLRKERAEALKDKSDVVNRRGRGQV